MKFDVFIDYVSTGAVRATVVIQPESLHVTVFLSAKEDAEIEKFTPVAWVESVVQTVGLGVVP